MIQKIKGLAGYLLWSENRLPADIKTTIFELAQNRGQIFGVLEGTEQPRQIRFEIPQNCGQCTVCFWILLRILMHFRKKFTSQTLFGLFSPSFWHPQIENRTIFEVHSVFLDFTQNFDAFWKKIHFINLIWIFLAVFLAPSN